MTQDFLVRFFISLGVFYALGVFYLYVKWVHDAYKELEDQRKQHEIEIFQLIQSIKKVEEARKKHDS